MRVESGVDVCYGSLADISERIGDVRFSPESGRAERQQRRPLSANSGHRLWAVSGYSRERASRFWLGASGSLRLGCLHSKL